jgi:hypothetical protein
MTEGRKESHLPKSFELLATFAQRRGVIQKERKRRKHE